VSRRKRTRHGCMEMGRRKDEKTSCGPAVVGQPQAATHRDASVRIRMQAARVRRG
jgi:hypothetical protein